MVVDEYLFSFQFHLAVDDGKKGNWLRKEFSFSMAVVEDFNVFQFQDFFLNAMAVDFLSCISDWNPTQHWLEMTMATIRSG